MRQKKKQEPDLALLIILVGFFILGYLFLDNHERPTGSLDQASLQPQVSAYSPEAESKVNKHLFMTNQEQYLQQKKMDAENRFYSPDVGTRLLPPVKKSVGYGVDHSPDRYESSIYRDLNRDKPEVHLNYPDQVIQGQLADELIQKELDENEQREYVRQFIDNARRAGYDVSVNSENVVTRVRPLPGRIPNAEDGASLHFRPASDGGAK